MRKNFWQLYNEITGWKSYGDAVGANIPSSNLSGVTSINTGLSNFSRGSYGTYDQPQNPTFSVFKNYLKKDIENDMDNMNLPTVIKKGKIKHINYKLNPVFIFLDDGTKIYIPYDFYKRIGKPKKNQHLTVTLQRKNSDGSNNPSKIQKIEVDK